MVKKVLLRGFILIAVILAIGTLFYYTVEDFTLIESFYFAGSALTASGYSNLDPVTPVGRIFTVLYTLVGIGTLFYIMGKLFHIMFSHTLLDPVFHESHQIYYKKILENIERRRSKRKKKNLGKKTR